MNDGDVSPDAGAPAMPLGPAPTAAGRELTLQFRGDGAEYFRIWIVNLLLSIVTFGIYSAWAKVRRLRYFYGNTYLDGASFGYHADPRKILKGRIIATVFFVAYSFGGQISPALSAAAGLVFAIALPWIVVRSRMFQLRSTSYRNIRFGFERCYRQAIALYLGWGALVLLSLGLLMPWWQARRYRLIVGNSRFGTTTFAAELRSGRFYSIYYRAGLLFIGAILVMTAVAFAAATIGKAAVGTSSGMSSQMWLVLAAGYLVLVPLLLLGNAFLQASVLNTVYNATSLGPHRLRSELRTGTLFRIYVGNLVRIVLTLGLYVPWARIRLARYRAETMTVIVHGSLDDFIAVEAEAGSAVGEEIGEFFDVDFGL